MNRVVESEVDWARRNPSLLLDINEKKKKEAYDKIDFYLQVRNAKWQEMCECHFAPPGPSKRKPVDVYWRGKSPRFHDFY
jgi:hypothetical protein